MFHESIVLQHKLQLFTVTTLTILLNASVTFDGQINVPIEANDTIRISKSKVLLKLIQPPNISFLSILREKLGWGFKP